MRIVFAILLAVSFGVVPAQAGGNVVVGSKLFTESRLLAEVMAQLIEARTDITVTRRLGLGGTKICLEALKNGDIDIYPEYTGTGWAIHLEKTEKVRDPTRTYLEVAGGFHSRWDLVWLMPFGFNNTYAMAMLESSAERLGVTRVSQLGPHLKDLKVGVSHEFLNREDGFQGLAVHYGFEIPPGLRGMEHGLAYEGLRSGAVDLVDAYSTDGKLLRFPVRVLEDDREFFPPYHAAPVVRGVTLKEHPKLEATLNLLGFRLPDDTMRAWNKKAEESGGDFAGVATELLRERGLLGEGAGPAKAVVKPGFFGYMANNAGPLMGMVGTHIGLTLAGVLLAILFAVPLGVMLTRRQGIAPYVLGLTGMIQTVPSLALLAFMIPIPGLGLGVRSAIAALFLYALLPILRNTYTGIQEVDQKLIEAARGMGLRDREILWRIELPLATRTIMAGIRTATVISVGVATLAAFVGAGGLGDPILTGLQLNDTRLILSGAFPAAALAIVADQALGWLERFLAPPGMGPRQS